MSQLLLASASGCYGSHAVHAAAPLEDAGAPLAPDASPPLPPPAPAICLDQTSVALRLGPERGCVTRDLTLAPAQSCHPAAGVTRQGVGLRLFRETPGRVDLRITAATTCAWTLHELLDIDCQWCGAIAHDRSPVVPGTLLPFADNGLLELLLSPEPGAGPCTDARLTVCFDPDYGEPTWDD